MEVSDAAWRAVLASIDRYESGEALLEALLNDQPLPDAPLASSAVDSQCEGRALVRSSSTSPSSSSAECAETEETTATTTTAVVAPTKKRRRVPQTRPKEEIDRLRESFAELTALLELLQQRQAKRPCGASWARVEGADTLVTARVWKAVAGRQYQYLRDSQAINEKLRMQLRVQMNIIQSFVRLIKRAQAGLPTILVPQSLLDRQTSDLFGTRRRRLLDAIDNMASELETTMQADPFTRTFDGDFREVWLPPDGTELPGGALLVTSLAGYLAPRSQRVISERWWERIRKRTSRIQHLHFKHVDRGENSETVSYSVGFATAIGSATYSGLAMSRRVERQDGGIVFLGVHELCPTESTRLPMTAVEYRMETVSLILPFQASHSYSQVVVKTAGMRLEHPLVPNLSEPQAAILRRFVTDTLDFLHVQLQQQLDVDILDVSSE